MLQNKAHIPFINNLRGIAAVSVCLFHFVYSTVNYVNNKTVLDVAYYGQFGVALFFVISGIVIPLSLLRANFTIADWPKFFMKRIIRIEPPYIAAIILSLIIILARRQLLKDTVIEVSIAQVALHLGYLIPFFKEFKWLNEVFWTLAIEFQYYLIISFLILLVIKGKLIGRIIFYAIMLALPFYFLDTNFFPPYSALFLTGIVWSFYYVNKINAFEFLFVFIASLVAVYLKMTYVEAVVALTSIIAVQFFNTWSHKLLDFFGNISYSLYLIHPLIGASLINIFSHTFFMSWQKPIVIAFGFSVTVLSSYIMYRFIEKPSQLLSKRITY